MARLSSPGVVDDRISFPSVAEEDTETTAGGELSRPSDGFAWASTDEAGVTRASRVAGSCRLHRGDELPHVPSELLGLPREFAGRGQHL